MYDNSDNNFPRVGLFHSDDGNKYPAEQKAPDGNFRKRSTRYFKNGKWSEWCKDDHDRFVARAKDGGKWSPFSLPEGAAFPEPLKFPTWKAGGMFIDSIKRNLEEDKATVYAGMGGTWPLPWVSVWNKNGDGDAEWTRLSLVYCDEWDGKTYTPKPDSRPGDDRPVYVLHTHFAPGSAMSDHPARFTPVHKFATHS